MEYTVYILFSDKFKKTYVGQTDNVSKRVNLHNSGRVKSTKRYIPWRLIHTEQFETRSGAVARERWYKSPTGRKSISRFL